MSDFKKNIINGAFWSAIEKYSIFFVGFLTTMVLTRLLAPHDFGVIAAATVVINFLSIFSTMGIGPAVIQRNDLSQADLDNIFSISAIIGFVLAVIFFLSSWAIAFFFNNNLLVSVCQLLSICILFGSLNIVPAALMAKNKRFKEMAKRTIIIQIVVCFFSIFAAYHKIGIYSLLIAPIITSVSIFFINIHYYPVKLRNHISFEPIKKIYSYSSFQFAFDITNYFSRNLDKLIVGKIISSEALGFYDKSYRLMQLPSEQLTGVINPVLQPFMSALQDNMSEMSERYNKIIKFIGSISIPLSVYLFFVGTELICLFFGEPWKPAASSFKILSISLATQMILSTSGSIWQSCNATNYLFKIGLVNTAITTSGFFIASIWERSIESIATAWTVTAFINFFTTYIIMYKKILKSSFFSMLKGLGFPLANATLLFVFLYIFEKHFFNSSYVFSLLIKTLIFIATTLSFLFFSKQINISSSKKSSS